MAFTWAIAPTDYDFIINRDGQIQTVYGTEEVRQRIIVTLNHFWAEYFLATDHGMPWYEIMLGSKDYSMVESLIKRAVLGVPGVISIMSTAVSNPTGSNNRQFAISIRAEVEGILAPNIVDIEYSLINFSTFNGSSYAGPSVLSETGMVLLDESGSIIYYD